MDQHGQLRCENVETTPHPPRRCHDPGLPHPPHLELRDDAAVAAIIRAVMPAFGADGPGFAIHDPEVDHYAAYAQPRCSYFVVERGGVVVGGGGVAPLEGGEPENAASCAR
ncbi:hypothetical protein RLIN73S_06581 [Rhodanobacter lindaniclasticus]